MADLTIAGTVLPVTPASPQGNDTPRFYLAGEDITQGVPFYFDEAAGTYKKADADAGPTQAALAVVVGVSVGEAKSGQLFPALSGGAMTLGTTAGLLVGMQYVLSGATGLICPYTDLATGDWVTYLFWWDGAKANMNIAALPVQWP